MTTNIIILDITQQLEFFKRFENIPSNSIREEMFLNAL
jgi:hypothetical protein